MSVYSQDELDERVQQAESLFAQGDEDAAFQLLSQVVAANPGHVRALNDLGTLCYSGGAMDYAVQFFQRALALDPAHLTCRVNLATLLLDRQQLASARELLEEGKIRHPGASAWGKLEPELLEREATLRQETFDRAFQQFLQQPEACAAPDSPVLRDLIRGWGNEAWGADADYLAACIRCARVADGPILECGSGLSTLLAAAAARPNGHGYWALEHLPEWRDRVQQALDRYGMGHVQLRARPLRNYGSFCWYDAPLSVMPPGFALVICDGPPGATAGGRSGLMPVMKSRLRPGCVLLIDDAHREPERAMAANWKEELGGTLETGGTVRPYLRLTLPKADPTAQK